MDSNKNGLHALIDAAFSGSITVQQAKELELFLATDRSACEVYGEYATIEVGLHLLVRANNANCKVCDSIHTPFNDEDRKSEDDHPPLHFPAVLGNVVHGVASYLSSDWLVSYLVAAVIFGVGSLITSHIYISPPEQIADSSPSTAPLLAPAVVQSERKLVGQITGLVDCHWSDSHTVAYLGRRVAAGDAFAIASGLAEITYDTGAKVLLQGPVTYQVDSSCGGFLSVGKLTARVEKKTASVPWSAASRQKFNPQSPIHNPPLFAVRTPTAIVTDLGTEFGVEVRNTGETQSHVFHGSVQLQQIGVAEGKETSSNTIILHANEAASIKLQHATSVKEKAGKGSHVKENEFVLSRGEFDATAFVLPGLMRQYAEEERLKPFRRWQAYSQKLRKDPSLLAYYDFQMKGDNCALLPNLAVIGGRLRDGIVAGGVWTEGRMPGKQALHFSNKDDHVQIQIPEKTNDITLAAWVNVDALPNNCSALLASEVWKPTDVNHVIHWQITSDGRIATIHVSKPVFSRDRIGKWTHFVLTYDHAAARVWIYINGKLVDDSPAPPFFPIQIGTAWIGQWSISPRGFCGLMDELAIFNRALKSEEISKFFEAGKPENFSN
jgi:hypothetical protein